MTSASFLAAVHVIYASVLYALINLMKNREKPKWVTWVGVVHNINMSLWSLIMLVGLIYGGFYERRFESVDAFSCNPPLENREMVPFWMYIFYLSNVASYISR